MATSDKESLIDQGQCIPVKSKAEPMGLGTHLQRQCCQAAHVQTQLTHCSFTQVSEAAHLPEREALTLLALCRNVPDACTKALALQMCLLYNRHITGTYGTEGLRCLGTTKSVREGVTRVAHIYIHSFILRLGLEVQKSC